MIPLPDFLFQKLSGELQLLSSQFGVAFLRWVGVSVYLEGNVIDLGDFSVAGRGGLQWLALSISIDELWLPLRLPV